MVADDSAVIDADMIAVGSVANAEDRTLAQGDRRKALPGSIAARLEAARQDLLDLGLRNSLLNYRLLRGRGVEVVDELPQEVFRLLVSEGKAMTFVPAPEREGSAALPLAFDDDPTGVPAARHVDLRLQTAESPQQLQKRLLATYYTARTLIEEQGINTLYIAIGMLRWYEADSAAQPRQAPLILVPVTLERSNARERFKVRYSGEDIEWNLSLAARLKQDVGIALPSLPEGGELDVAAYFDVVSQAIAGQNRWTVDRNAITLGFFSFAKLLMYRDLDGETWPDDGQPSDDSHIRAVLGEGFRDPDSQFGDDDRLDEHAEPDQLRPVVDADSSQTLAILDVRGGRNLVIQGPPGTGKSQTITNLIAQAVADGKTVLFVAEKMAALEVVKRRLDQIGLGDACLELHSRNTQKRALLNELARTLELGRPRIADLDGEEHRFEDARRKLNGYAEAVNSPLGESGITPYQALGEMMRMRQTTPKSHGFLGLTDMASWSAATFRDRLSRVEDLQIRLRAVGVPAKHPFWGSGRIAFAPTEMDEVRQTIQRALDSVETLRAAALRLATLGGREGPPDRAALTALFPPGWQIWRSFLGKDRTARASARAALAAHADSVGRALESLQMDEARHLGADRALTNLPFVEQTTVLQTWVDDLPRLADLASYTELIDQCRTEGFGELAAAAEAWPPGAMGLADAFRYEWFDSLLKRAYRERTPLARFSRESHELTLHAFREMDVDLIRRNSVRLSRAHWDALPRGQTSAGQLAVLHREFQKKMRHLPIRKLILGAGNAIQAIKPVFMMSPLSIANYLPPQSLTFDLVIFDEASQVRPVDAFGALLRGTQAVVVGDSRQLPPTSFFDALTEGDDIDEENATDAIESILGLFAAQLAPTRMLRWHYRSRHESLIAVSNHAFYNDRLVVFPSPDAARDEVGLIFHHLPESSYDRGGTRANTIEAEAVAQAVMDHARIHPEHTLGVAAFSVAQMQAIQDRLELLRRNNPECENFFAAHPHEQFFVKNLETVQGDERDVIFISIGYGRTAEGFLIQSFGPLNAEGGERRLNVLITRARRRCEVFSNLKADDIQADGKGAGVHALKLFLKYAQTGILDVPVPTGMEADSPFEVAVAHELRLLGYEIQHQVGSAGFRIDLAVVDPEHPGRYILGIECDGATYHSARTARDRDRLRQQVLEDLGWTIHRVWSTDWFRDQGKELTRIVAAIQACQNPAVGSGAPAGARDAVEPIPVGSRDAPPPHTSRPVIPPYTLARLGVNTGGVELHLVRPSTMAEWVTAVVKLEGPVHESEVARRIADAVGVRRVGHRIETSIHRACLAAEHQGTVWRRDSFLWAPGMTRPVLRDRGELPLAARKLELVAPEEIEVAICTAIAEAYGMDAADVPAVAARLLGFQRVSEPMHAHFDALIESLLRRGVLMRVGTQLQMAEAGENGTI